MAQVHLALTQQFGRFWSGADMSEPFVTARGRSSERPATGHFAIVQGRGSKRDCVQSFRTRADRMVLSQHVPKCWLMVRICTVNSHYRVWRSGMLWHSVAVSVGG